ncbi:hypothetical protein Q4578_00420 [Shimia thalassica]|uniref:hypothetical protein n=1 Tax=Shimia thalassica TaxID=1715693 RepID=UPI000C06E16B|nr:hypothetical protein [Shimia thalassica]PHO03391.1 hypothetical protein CSC82_15965 [Rhodobacteraceae bacterium 4F10]MBU2944397.1 hypothetical protein [Shimia thalassica]MDO6479448.1 hypothetical protein [Shimia thalassica]MDO6482634.1 hypothetical protein [Shimia thalassica]MDO6502257.1 hypothetical protein [Shimia thalassica]
MLVERTLTQLQVEATTTERAQELGRMGYIQWLGWLPGHASYEAEAVKAYLVAMDFVDTDPAVAVFCDLIRKSLRRPLVPLDLSLPKPRRKGGAKRRRDAL